MSEKMIGNAEESTTQHADQPEKQHGKLWLVGVGPGDPKHLTLYAIEAIHRADLILSREAEVQIVKQYIEGKRIEGPERWDLLWKEDGIPWIRNLPQLNVAARCQKVAQKNRERDDYAAELKRILSTGKHVVILDGGDPTVFSLFFFWLLEAFPPEQVEIVPGIGALNASLAALKICGTATASRFVVQTEPRMYWGERMFEQPNDALPTSLADKQGTVIFYMAAEEIPQLTGQLKKYYPQNTPAAVVYNAGRNNEKIYKGTLATIGTITANEEEKWLGLFILGRCLNGPVIWTPES